MSFSSSPRKGRPVFLFCRLDASFSFYRLVKMITLSSVVRSFGSSCCSCAESFPFLSDILTVSSILFSTSKVTYPISSSSLITSSHTLLLTSLLISLNVFIFHLPFILSSICSSLLPGITILSISYISLSPSTVIQSLSSSLLKFFHRKYYYSCNLQ